MDDLSWAENAVGEMEFLCLTSAMEQDPSAAQDDNLAPENIVRFMCPRQCSGRGRCVESRCNCNTGG